MAETVGSGSGGSGSVGGEPSGRSRAQTGESGHTRDLNRPEAPEPLRSPVVDSHCHLDIEDGETPLGVDEALARAIEVGVTRVVQIGCDLPSARWSVKMARTHAGVWAGVGLHPNEAPRLQIDHGDEALDAAYAQIDELVAHDEVRGVGETGLDFFRTGESGRGIQEASFRRHITMAKKYDKALIIHDRDAHDDVIRVLEDEGAPRLVVFHCFSGDADMARYCSERGWYVSFAGVLTFKNAQSLRDACKAVPLDRILVETDAPFLTPVPYRGRPNASYLIPLTVRAMAQVHGVDETVIAENVWTNSESVFGPL